MLAKIDPSTLPGRPCSLAAALEIVGERWSLLAVREVLMGNHQFNQIVRNTGAPTDRLAARLKDLVSVGVLERRRAGENDRFAGYYLTDAGADLANAARQLMQWGDDWVVNERPLTTWHHDHRFIAKQVCTECGEEVRVEDLTQETTATGWSLAGPVKAEP